MEAKEEYKIKRPLRAEQIRLMVSAEEKATADAAAMREGITLSQYIRNLMRAAAEK